MGGEWEMLSLESRHRFRLNYRQDHVIDSPLGPIPARVEFVFEQTKPFAFPPPPITFADWVAAAGLAGAAGGPEADPDADQLPNLVEFGWDRHPASPDVHPLPLEATVADGWLTASFVRHAGRRGLGYFLEVSEEFARWKTIAAAVEDADASGVGGGVVLSEKSAGPGQWRVTVRAPMPITSYPAQFARLRLELSGD
jgi:hypothetical protein